MMAGTTTLSMTWSTQNHILKNLLKHLRARTPTPTPRTKRPAANYGKPKEKEKIMKAVSTAAPGGIWSRIAHWLVMADRMARASMAIRKEKEKGNPMAASPKDMAGNHPTFLHQGQRQEEEWFQGQGLWQALLVFHDTWSYFNDEHYRVPWIERKAWSKP